MKIHKISRIRHKTQRLSDRFAASYLKTKLDLRIKSDTYSKSSKINNGKS